MSLLLPYLAAVQVEQVETGGPVVRVVARTRDGPVACPGCGVVSERGHSRYARRIADVGIGGRPVLVELSVRRMYCGNDGCVKATFVEQVSGLTERYQRRTPGARQVLEAVGIALAGRAGARLALVLGLAVSWMTMLNLLMRIRLPQVPVPEVLSVDDFALRRSRRYGALLIDAVSHRRVDVLPDRRAETLTAWLKDHPGVKIVCRDGSTSFAEAIAAGAPKAVQVSDRWHLWHGLAGVVEKTVVAHAGCWNTTPRRPGTLYERNTRARFAAVHELTDAGVGIKECARRLHLALHLALHTVRRYARAADADQLLQPPGYRSCQVDPYRDLIRERLAAHDCLAQIRRAIRAEGYRGGEEQLRRYILDGRADPERAVPSPRRLTGWIMSRPADLPGPTRRHLDDLALACPEMTRLVTHVREFAEILTERRGPDLSAWIAKTRIDALPGFDTFLNGLENDRGAAVAGLSLPYSNGPIEGCNTKLKLIKRKMYGRAGFPLLRQMILLN